MKRVSFLLPLLALTACVPDNRPQPTSNRDEQARLSAQAAAEIRFNSNAERDNIRRRLELTADAALLGYIILFNESGQPIMYEGVRGKVTTSGSRLTPPDRINRDSRGEGGISQVVIRAPSDTGTYDTGSTTFIYYWNTDGTYRQWSGHYLYSTSPIRTRIEPLVVTVAEPAR